MATVKDVMDINIVEVQVDINLKELLALIREYGIQDFPVVDSESRFKGMVYERDLLQLLCPQGQFAASLEPVQAARISEIMHRDVATAFEHESLEEAGLRMLRAQTAMMPVIRENKIIGLVRQSHIFRELASHLIATFMPPAHHEQAVEVKAGSKGEDHRFFERADAILPVAYKLADEQGRTLQGEARLAETVNISAGGLLIRTREKLPLRALIHIALDLFQDNQPIRRLCRTVRCLRAEDSASFKIGLLFLGMSAAERKKIDAYVKKLGHNQGGHS